MIFAAACTAQMTALDSTVSALKGLSLEELLDLEVTSVSRRPEKLLEAASAIQVITDQDIRRSGATSLAESLRLASNLQVAQINSHDWAISARGFNASTANKLLVLMDGRTLYSPLHAAVFWDVQDTMLEDVERIEVISGPGATLWGSNAVNGVISITTKSAKDTQGLLVSGGVGTAVRSFGSVRYGGELAPGVHFRIYGKYSDRNSTEFTDGRSGVNDGRMEQAGFRVDWDSAVGSVLTVQGDAYDLRVAQPTGADRRASGNNVLGRWTRTLSEDSNLMVQLYFDRTHRLIPGTFLEDLDTYDFDFQHRVLIGGKHGITWGAGYRLVDDEQGNAFPVLAFLPAEVTREWVSTFVQDELSLLDDRLHLTLGMKLEHNDYTGLEFQPSARFAWLPDRHQTLWGAISRAVRTPSRIDGEFFAPRDPPFTQLQGNPDFESEELLAYELGYRTRPLPQLSLAVALFHHDYDRLRSIERINPPAQFPFFLGNLQEGRSTGAELTGEYQATGAWRLKACYTQLHLRLRNKPGSTAAPPVHTDPEHQFLLRSSVDLPGNFEWDVAYRFVSRIESVAVPSYEEIDMRLSWALTDGLELSVVGQNLLNSRHGEFNPTATRQQIARSVYAKFQWQY